MHHILDPRTGMPVRSGWRTVSVAAATCAEANSATTAAIVRGEPALEWLSALGLPARLLDRDGHVTTVGDWPVDPREPTGELPATGEAPQTGGPLRTGEPLRTRELLYAGESPRVDEAA